jgi:hemoglobin
VASDAPARPDRPYFFTFRGRDMRKTIWAVVAMLAATGAVSAQPADPLPRAELDKRIKKAAYDAAVAGTEIYNTGGQEGCYRFYEGTLLALWPMLDHNPELAKTVADKLAKAKGMAKYSEKAFALREAIDILMGVPPATAGAKKPLWDRLGGEPAVKAVVHDFVMAAATDPKVNFFRDGMYKLDAAGVAKLERLLVELISAVTGGPLKYTGRDMKTSHAGMKITEEEFGALAGDLIATLKKFKVPQAEIDELVGIVATTKGDIVEVKK